MSTPEALHVTFNTSANPETIRKFLQQVMEGDDNAGSMAINWQAGSAVIQSSTPYDTYKSLSNLLAQDPQNFPLKSATVKPLAP